MFELIGYIGWGLMAIILFATAIEKGKEEGIKYSSERYDDFQKYREENNKKTNNEKLLEELIEQNTKQNKKIEELEKLIKNQKEPR